MYASLSNSYQWNLMNQDNSITTRISEILKNGTEVSVKELATAFSTIKNRIRSPIYSQLIEALNSGRLIMIVSTGVRVPLYLPFVVMKPSKGVFTGIVFLDHCEVIPLAEGATEYMVNARKLKVSLESCYMAIRMMELDALNNTKLTAPSLIRPATKIYTFALTECINRKYSIKLDQTVYNQMIFMISKFFITSVLGYHPNDDTLENYSLYNCKNVELSSIRLVSDQFADEDFKDISTFITTLTNIPELKGRIGKLNVSGLVQMYVNLYGAPMTLSLEVFPYLVYNVLSVLQSTYANNYHMLKNIVGDDGSKLYTYLISILAE